MLSVKNLGIEKAQKICKNPRKARKISRRFLAKLGKLEKGRRARKMCKDLRKGRTFLGHKSLVIPGKLWNHGKI